mmetsp:Transcript_57604/g.148177  ORF Transcript_57604/g.148177 Transcript_57604/m.148177 type:complete len:233 (+) Transcript_57604:182-880(+)
MCWARRPSKRSRSLRTRTHESTSAASRRARDGGSRGSCPSRWATRETSCVGCCASPRATASPATRPWRTQPCCRASRSTPCSSRRARRPSPRPPPPRSSLWPSRGTRRCWSARSGTTSPRRCSASGAPGWPARPRHRTVAEARADKPRARTEGASGQAAAGATGVRAGLQALGHKGQEHGSTKGSMSGRLLRVAFDSTRTLGTGSGAPLPGGLARCDSSHEAGLAPQQASEE